MIVIEAIGQVAVVSIIPVTVVWWMITLMAESFGASKMMKKATPFIYARISSDEQSVQDKKVKEALKKTTIKRQIKLIQDELVKQGLPKAKKNNIYAEVASGTKRDRKEWLRLQADIMAHEGAAFAVVKNPSRWARSVEDAVEAWAPMKRRGIPLYAIADNIQTGSINDRRPQESLWFVMNQGWASLFSAEQADKAEKGVTRQESEGALAGTGSSLHPFATKDPLEILLENEHLLSQPKGATKLKNIVETLSMPNGMKAASVAGLRNKIKDLRSVLPPNEFDEWVDFRRMLRDMLIELESDPWTGRLDISKGSKENYYPARALMRMSGLYLTRPHEFKPPSREYLSDVVLNFTDYLSDKDKKARGKR